MEGIVSKRLGSPYRSGRSPDWLKSKNPACEAVRREERGRLGSMTHRENLAEADRFIAGCKDRIARQREIIATAYENGHPTVLPVALLRVLEENLRSFEKYRLLILDQ